VKILDTVLEEILPENADILLNTDYDIAGHFYLKDKYQHFNAVVRFGSYFIVIKNIELLGSTVNNSKEFDFVSLFIKDGFINVHFKLFTKGDYLENEDDFIIICYNRLNNLRAHSF
jgi:hypothetical protein